MADTVCSNASARSSAARARLCPSALANTSASARTRSTSASGQSRQWRTQPSARQPLRLLVALPPGSTSDLVARLLADALRARLERPVVVENRPGASGGIAVEALKHAAPDGARLLLAPVFVPMIAPLVLKDLRYDPVKDLAPVAQVSIYEFAFAVAPQLPAGSIAEFVAWARANPGRASVGNSAPGSLPHFVAFMFGQAAAVELLHVPYKGVAQIETELMGRQIAAGVGTITDLAPLHRAGKLRVLAVTGTTRSARLPGIPTFREQGYPAVDAAGWHGIFAPGGTPQPEVDRLSAAIVAAMRAPEMREKFVALGLEPTGTTPKKLAEIIAADAAHWAPIVRKAGFSAE